MARAGDVLQLTGYWYIAARVRELRARPLARTVLGRPLVLFRGADGAPAALLDRCAHRNMALSRGQVRGGCVECPYHGWRYAGDGRCVEIPSLRSGPPPLEAAVPAYPALESDGFVWVHMGDGPPARPLFRFPHYREPGWASFLMVTRFPAGAMACLENFLDCPHTVYVHEGWFRSRAAREVRARITSSDDEVVVEFMEERDAESVISRLLFPTGRELRHTDRFLMPATTRVDYSFGQDRHFIITSQCTPVTEHETMVYTMATFRFGRIAPLVRCVFEPVARKILRQDYHILAAQAAQIRRFGGPQFTVVETDLVGPRIQELWRRARPSAPTGESRAGPEERAPAAEELLLRF